MVTLVPLELNVWCYVVAGSLLLLTNLPIFLVIISTKQLRVTFGALATIFATGTLTGFTSITKGFMRFAAIKAGNTQLNNLSAVYCLKKAFVILDLFTFPSLSVLSMVNSFDRLLVVSMPLFYFKKAKLIVITEIISAILAILLLETFTITAAVYEDHHVSSTFCSKRNEHMLPWPEFYEEAAAPSYAHTLEANYFKVLTDYGMHTMITSKVAAYFAQLLDLLPNVVVVIARLSEFENEDDYISYSRILCMLNGVIMVIVIMWYKTEVREIIFHKACSLLRSV
ncbi:unnamed protein product [Toxocara canis]|uniref:G_PROTEIN_RECEP_F1_2 domain-containing protein n=1 Tax=Toxocara canis TaxID=6265 RepID=A0A183V363_TOXCA|nr:unnamed protein product [Toxocara canis]